MRLSWSKLGEGAHALVGVAALLQRLGERQVDHIVEQALGLGHGGAVDRGELLGELQRVRQQYFEARSR